MTSENATLRGPRPTVLSAERATLLAAYAAELEGAALAADTRRTYVSRVRMFLAWLPEGNVPAGPVVRDRAVRAYKEHLAVLGRSAQYVNNALAALDDFFARRGPGRTTLGRDRLAPAAPRELDAAGLARWSAAAEAWPHSRDRLLALLPSHTGLRVGELVGLDVQDVRRLRDPRFRAALDAWLADRSTWPGSTGDALFLNRRGGRLSTRAATGVFSAIAASAGLAVTPDLLRAAHTPVRRQAAEPGERHRAGEAEGVRRGGLRGGQRERRERVVDAAVRMMAERDYDKIQVKDVADEAGVALGTLYRYFASKDHLFACALSKWGHGFGGRLVHPAGATALERVTAIYLKAARAFEGDTRVYEMITQLESTRDARAAEIYAEFVRTQNRAFATALVDLPAEQHKEIVWVMGAVLSEALRSRMLGLFDMAGVYERIETAARLILK